MPFIARWEASSAKQREDETLYEFKLRVQELLRKAYPNAAHLASDMGREIFLRGLSDKNITLAVYQQDPQTLDEAFAIAKSTATLRKGLGVDRKTRRIEVEDEEHWLRGMQLPDEDRSRLRRLETANQEQSKQIQKLQSTTESFISRQSASTPNRGCFRCGDINHFQKDCPRPSPSRHMDTRPSPPRPSYNSINMGRYQQPYLPCPNQYAENQTQYTNSSGYRYPAPGYNLSPARNQFGRAGSSQSPERVGYRPPTPQNSPVRLNSGVVTDQRQFGRNSGLLQPPQDFVSSGIDYKTNQQSGQPRASRLVRVSCL